VELLCHGVALETMQHDLCLRCLDCNSLQLTQFALHSSQVAVGLATARAVFPGYLHRYFGFFSLTLLFHLAKCSFKERTCSSRSLLF
jgi:hypothetical protein